MKSASARAAPPGAAFKHKVDILPRPAPVLRYFKKLATVVVCEESEKVPMTRKKAYSALPVDLQRTLDHAAAAVQVYRLCDFHAKNAIALERLKTEFKGKAEVVPLSVPMLRDLKKPAAEVVREGSEKSPMARKVHASFTKFQALLGPRNHVAEGAYHQFAAL